MFRRRLIGGLRAGLAVTATVIMTVAGSLAISGTAAANTTASVYTGIDGYPVKQLPGACNGTEQPGTRYLRQMLMNTVGGTNLGTAVCSAGTSYHREPFVLRATGASFWRVPQTTDARPHCPRRQALPIGRFPIRGRSG